MERDKLIEILENGSEAELTLIQNYLLDKILKKMPAEAEAIERCIETSEKIKNLEAEIVKLRLTLSSIQDDLVTVGKNSSGYYTTIGTGSSSWDVTCSSSNATSYTSTTIV